VQVNSSEEKQHEWGAKVQMQEAVFNGDVVRKNHKRTDNIDNTIDAVDSSVLEMKTNLGVFWPEALWNAKHPESTAKKSELMSLPGHGKRVVKEEMFGKPIGTIDLAGVVQKKVFDGRACCTHPPMLWMMMRRTACGRRRRIVLRLGEILPALFRIWSQHHLRRGRQARCRRA